MEPPAIWQEQIRRFGAEARGSSPLYERLAAGVASDPEILAWVARASGPRANANLLFAAVHYLLLTGCSDPLNAFYPSLTRQPMSPATAYPIFRDFCVRHREALTELLATRVTQTNEVGRSSYLYPALIAAAANFRRPLHLVDVGTAAGLNLFPEKYHYDYGGETQVGPATARVRLRIELRGVALPLAPQPSFSGRVGIDLAPIDPADDEGTRWLEACVWPEHVDRLQALRSALAVARDERPQILRGNALELIPKVAATAHRGSALVVMNTNVLPYFTNAERHRFGLLLGALGSRRDVVWIAAEAVPLLRAAGFRGMLAEVPTYHAAIPLTMVSWKAGDRQDQTLAVTGPHARWLEWL